MKPFPGDVDKHGEARVTRAIVRDFPGVTMQLGYAEDQKQGVLDILDRALVRSRVAGAEFSFAVLLISLERFRAPSDILGHSFAEEVLNLGGDRMESALREQDRLLRLSNDEFVILLTSAPSAEESSTVARRLIDLLQRPYIISGEVGSVSASIGIVLGPENGSDAEQLLHRAGIALRCAKASGPGTCHLFEIALEERLKARHALTVDLRKALLLEQFEVYYQPQIRMKGRHLVGLEALLRWRHPVLGMVSPTEFIPIAEEVGLIGTIGDWVLRTACRQAALLPNEIVMAVNASPVQLWDGFFLDRVKRALSIADLPPSRLEIEITEGTLLQHTTTVLATLNGLHSMGVRLAIDDFGTGYSSFGRLAKLPFDTIKIDRSLVGSSLQQRAIVRSIAALGEGLGISVMAEGLETEEEFDSALSAGCITGQGYLFGKATPSGQLDELLARFSRGVDASTQRQCRRDNLRLKEVQRGVRRYSRAGKEPVRA
jgi:diguanylate cyclase (GGDEF)-like protein